MFLSGGPEELRALLDAFAVPMFVVDVEPDATLRYAAINAAFQAATGRTSAEMVGRRPEDCLALDAAVQVIDRYRACVATGRIVQYEVSLGGPAERWRTTLSPLVRDGRVVRLIAVTIDISDLRRAELARQQSEQRLAIALDAADAGLFDIDLRTGKATYNARAETMLGYAPGELSGRDEPFQERVHPDDRAAMRQRLDDHIAGRTPICRSEHRHRMKDGSWRWLIASGKVVERDPDGTPRRLLGIRIDSHERKCAQLQIEQMALQDTLTGLPNRLRFDQELERARAQATRSGRRIALLVFDLDHFKEVNDTLGHSAGDALLVEVGKRVRGCVRANDLVARLGGDEFAIIAGEHEHVQSVAALADRVVKTLGEPFTLDGAILRTGASMGVTILPDDQGDREQLLAHADVALYAAKSDGRGRWRLYDRSMHDAVQQRRSLESELREALEGGAFELYYQPVIDLRRRSVASVEALLRWNHPTRGLIAPAEFIPLAETSGLIVPLTEWVLRQALVQAQRWQTPRLRNLCIAVNLSRRPLKTAGLIDFVVRALAAAKTDPRRLIIEVTETSLADETHAVPVLDALRGLGVQVAVDDFGTGYSSMGRLRNLPVDRLKVDRSFVADMAADRSRAAIVESMIKLADSLNVRVVAEGIETDAQLRLLEELGCHEGQGFVFARPMPAGALAGWIERWSGPRARGKAIGRLAPPGARRRRVKVAAGA